MVKPLIPVMASGAFCVGCPALRTKKRVRRLQAADAVKGDVLCIAYSFVQ